MAATKSGYSGEKMGRIRTDSTKRYHCASLICDYLLKKNITRADVTARDIANTITCPAHLPSRSVPCWIFYTVTASGRPVLDFTSWEHRHLKKVIIPTTISFRLIDGAKGLLWFSDIFFVKSYRRNIPLFRHDRSYGGGMFLCTCGMLHPMFPGNNPIGFF